MEQQKSHSIVMFLVIFLEPTRVKHNFCELQDVRKPLHFRLRGMHVVIHKVFPNLHHFSTFLDANVQQKSMKGQLIML